MPFTSVFLTMLSGYSSNSNSNSTTGDDHSTENNGLSQSSLDEVLWTNIEEMRLRLVDDLTCDTMLLVRVGSQLVKAQHATYRLVQEQQAIMKEQQASIKDLQTVVAQTSAAVAALTTGSTQGVNEHGSIEGNGHLHARPPTIRAQSVSLSPRPGPSAHSLQQKPSANVMSIRPSRSPTKIVFLRADDFSAHTILNVPSSTKASSRTLIKDVLVTTMW